MIELNLDYIVMAICAFLVFFICVMMVALIRDHKLFMAGLDEINEQRMAVTTWAYDYAEELEGCYRTQHRDNPTRSEEEFEGLSHEQIKEALNTRIETVLADFNPDLPFYKPK